VVISDNFSFPVTFAVAQHVRPFFGVSAACLYLSEFHILPRIILLRRKRVAFASQFRLGLSSSSFFIGGGGFFGRTMVALDQNYSRSLCKNKSLD